ncbi:hypothetical protein A9K97_gp424 [Tokyovirus A1]|uniref:hypothetical protein n=1 Tax=Tokyovirus A1 TaxID=1826170 RepID=UPI0007A95E01|nr:hypothetical protein A9K97_gp424 [Tokyovirus A1]BAU79927.1 hypothetical protein [Tokyovirus A1]
MKKSTVCGLLYSVTSICLPTYFVPLNYNEFKAKNNRLPTKEEQSSIVWKSTMHSFLFPYFFPMSLIQKRKI